ncbi:MAG: outer membrane protein transport protein [Salinivirgaceae bacterium]
MKNLLLIAVFLWSASAYAEGYQVNLQGQKNTAMGHIGTAFIGGPSILHFNPGGMALLDKKMSFTAGVSLIFSNNIYQATDGLYQAETENPMGTPFYFYGVYKINDKMAAGLGVNTPYGNRLAWEDGWAGRYLNQDIAMQSITLQPTFSYKVSDWLSLGAGMLIGINSVELNKQIPITGADGEASVNLTGSTNTLGVNAGAMFTITDQLTAGISYRSQMKAKVTDGTTKINVPDALGTYFPEETEFKATLPFPANYNVGVAYQVSEKFLVSVDVNYVQWSVYDSLNFDFADNTARFQDSDNPRKYSDTYIFRIGAEYKVIDEVTLRAGAYYDQSPLNDDYYTPETPGANKTGIAGGATIKPIENFEIDLSLLYIHGEKRTSRYLPDNFEGTYYSNAVIPGIGFTYSF